MLRKFLFFALIASVVACRTPSDFGPENIEPVFTLVSKSVTKSASPLGNGVSLSTLTATFNVQIETQDTDITFGDASSPNPTFTFGIYRDGVRTVPAVVSVTNFSLPSAGVVTSGPGFFTIQGNTKIVLPVTFTFESQTIAGESVEVGNYAVGIDRIRWSPDYGETARLSIYMVRSSAWRTPAVLMP